jgi:hypothetical protein
MPMAENASTPGSNGLASNKKERSKWYAAAAPSKNGSIFSPFPGVQEYGDP